MGLREKPAVYLFQQPISLEVSRRVRVGGEIRWHTGGGPPWVRRCLVLLHQLQRHRVARHVEVVLGVVDQVGVVEHQADRVLVFARTSA